MFVRLLLALSLFWQPLCAKDKPHDVEAELKAMTTRALAAELRAAVAEERLASIPHQQASERSMAAFKAACEAEGIAVEKCEPDTKDWTVHAKPEPPKPEAKEPAK